MLTQRTWTQNLNITLQAGTQDAQAQDYAYQLKEALKLAGWTIAMSQTSTTVSTATDTWASYTDVTLGSSGAGGGAWFVATPPASFTSSSMALLFTMNDATSPRNVIRIDLLRNGSYALPGVANTLPTPTGTVTTLSGSLITAFAATTAIDARLAILYSTKGDLLVFFRGAGDAGARQMFMVYSNTDGSGGGFGGHRYIIGDIGSLTTNQLTWANIQVTANWLGVLGDGSATLNQPAAQSIAADLISWPSGIEVVGGVPACPIELAANSATANHNRDLGTMVDIMGAPTGFAAVTNAVQDSDDGSDGGAKRRRSLGVFWLPIDRAVTFP